ncbi:MAG: Hpt domain-containing protein [Eubacterium sp.]
MDKMLESLREYGADMDGAMGRFLKDMDLYKVCFTAFLNDENFQKLEESLLEKNYIDAFESAHTLKGVAGNMGLTPIYQIICTLVEALRNNEHTRLDDLYKAITEERQKLGVLQK